LRLAAALFLVVVAFFAAAVLTDAVLRLGPLLFFTGLDAVFGEAFFPLAFFTLAFFLTADFFVVGIS